LELHLQEQIPYPKSHASGIDELSQQAVEFVDTLVSAMLELRLCAEYFAGRVSADIVKPVSDWLEASGSEFEPRGSVPLARLPWSAVAGCLLDERDQPRMDVIVRIAEKFQEPLSRLAEAPRRILRRERAMTPLSRVQETDNACLEWLVRQPGITPVEKAGSRQQILAVVRTESYDTLENRVLKDFLRRCVDAANLYIDQNRRYSATERYRLVSRFRNRCRTLLGLEQWVGVSWLHNIPQPNYVLQHDRSYRELWKWYLQLVHRQKQADEAWRWQRRLWGDVVRLVVGAALFRLEEEEQKNSGGESGVSISAPYEQSVWLRDEQACGTWAAAFDWPGPVVVNCRGKRPVIVECVHPHDPRVASTHRREQLPAWCGAVGADLVLLFCPVGGHKVGRDVCLFIWAIHSAAEKPTDERVKGQTHTAYQALSQLQEDARDDNIVFSGLLLRSRFDGGSADLPSAGSVGGTEVLGLSLPADPAEWRDELLELLRTAIGTCADTCFG